MSIVVNDVSFHYFNHQPLFEHIGFAVPTNGKVAIVGPNGSGKSTLLKLLAGELAATAGSVHCRSTPYYIPQQIATQGQNIADAIGIAEKINALRAICNGSDNPLLYDLLADDWDIESRCRTALDNWNLTQADLHTPIDRLSGGEKTKVFLAGLAIRKPEIVLLDEPTNHLDLSSRQKLYNYIDNSKATIVAVSHDITLLNRLNSTLELSEKGLRSYGGNYAFYKTQKNIEQHALEQQLHSEETTLRQAQKKAREVMERQEKRNVRSQKNTSGIPRIILAARHDKGERTEAKLSEKHANIIAGSRQKLSELQQHRPGDQLKFNFDPPTLHLGKLLIAASDINFRYENRKLLWQTPLNIAIHSGERIHIKGDNGTGKTTLIDLLTGKLAPSSGKIVRAEFSYILLDQHYSPVDRDATILQTAESYNSNNLPDHAVKLRLNRALFPEKTWNKNCRTLSGGERLRLYLCCLMIFNHTPDMFILDEPSNNLDLSSLAILADTIGNYRGTLVVISHDRSFIDEIRITKTIALERPSRF
jgi:ATPase subunit of ABC transporter with duplicated ATPase domains